VRDPGLSRNARLLWVVLRTFVNREGFAWPSIYSILLMMDFSKDTFYKCVNELKAKGYMEVTQIHRADNDDEGKRGQWATNHYTLIYPPISSTKEPCPKKPCPKKSDTAFPDAEKAGYDKLETSRDQGISRDQISACSPRLCREDHQHYQARGDASGGLPLTGLGEKAESLKAEWSRCHQIVYGTKPKFSPADLKALVEFEEYVPESVYATMALVLFAWSRIRQDSSEGVNQYFHCNKISRMPAAWMNFCQWKCCKGQSTGLQAIVTELGWKFRAENIQYAYDWLERQASRHRNHAVKPAVPDAGHVEVHEDMQEAGVK